MTENPAVADVEDEYVLAVPLPEVERHPVRQAWQRTLASAGS